MKKAIITLLLIISISYGQTKQVKDTVYILKGIRQNFQILKFAITNPRDITPNQQDAILKWIETIKPETDSVKVKK